MSEIPDSDGARPLVETRARTALAGTHLEVPLDAPHALLVLDLRERVLDGADGAKIKNL